MRLLRSLLWLVALGGLGLIVLIFLIQNLHTERLVFFGLDVTVNFALVVVGAAALGFLLALVLIVPGRVAAALYARALDRELRQLERQVARLSEQRERLLEGQERVLMRYERLFADHGQAVAERDRMRAQLAAAIAPPDLTPGAARPPLSLRERETRGEVRAVPARVAPVAGDERVGSASASARSGRVLPPAAPDPPAIRVAPTTPDPPAIRVAPAAPDPPAIRVAPAAPDPPAIRVAVVTPSVPAAADPPGDSAAPPPPVRTSEEGDGAPAPAERWRSQVARVRGSAGAMYNDVRKTLRLASARATKRWRQDASPPDTRESSAVSTAEDSERESAAPKGEQSL